MDFTLSEEHKRWRAVAREFAEQVIKHDAARRDRLPTAAERIPWDWIREADKLGIRTLGVPGKYGGAGADILTLCLVGEELAVGDLGFAVIMDQCWKMAHILSDAMTPEQQEKFIPAFVKDPEATFAIGFTEVGAGSDHQGYYDSPDIAFHTTAVRDGDTYVINGAKRYVSNGCMAKLYFVVARTDTSRNLREGGSVFIVPSDTPGFRAGFFHEKSSQRLATNGTFHFKNCPCRRATSWAARGSCHGCARITCGAARRKRRRPRSAWGARLTSTRLPMRRSACRVESRSFSSRQWR